jgi:DNA-binding response OmpR family regulator
MQAMLIATEAEERHLLNHVLQRAGLRVATAGQIEHALASWPERPADMLVLALPGSGEEEAVPVGRVRGVTPAPVIFICDRLTEVEHAALLERGVDLVITRPYSSRLLVAQVQALLRRAGGVPIFTLPTLSHGGLVVDPASRAVQRSDGKSRRLTQLEFRLLYALMLHRGQVVPTDAIVEQVWGYTGDGNRELVRGLVSRLRSKIEPDPQQPRHIETLPGVGYRLLDVVDTP